MNVSNNETISDDFNYLIWDIFSDKDYVIIGLYIPIILLALIANLIFIVIVITHRYMRRTSSYFLINLSIADLLVTFICMPRAMWKAYTDAYYLGRYSCKIFTYLECVAVASSILTITAMAMHRYFGITKPLFGIMYPSMNRCGTILIIISLWVLSMFIFSPLLWVYDLDIFPLEKDMTIYFCVENWDNIIISRHTMGILWFVFVFLIPGLTMLIAYSTMGQTLCSDTKFYDDSTCTYQRGRLIRTRRKVACILLLLALIFATCWLPHHIMNLIDDAEDLETDELELASVDDSITDYKMQQERVKRYLLLLGHLNSALNPIVYFALSRKFRNSIQELCCRGSCGENQREFTRATIIKLNTLRNPMNSRSLTTKKPDGIDTNNCTAR